MNTSNRQMSAAGDLQRAVGCRGLRVLAMVGALLALAACAQVPVVDDSPTTARSAGDVQLMGRRGPLSRHQSKLLLQRLAARSPDAGLLERHLAVEQAVADSPLFPGNQVQILRDGEQTFPAMFAVIKSAQRYLYLEYYIFEDVSCDGEQLSDLLISKAQSGVAVYVIYDGIGSLSTPSDFINRLQASQVHVLEYNPLNPMAHGHFSLNSRDHRKMLIADGGVAIIGGVNLSSTYQSGPGSSQTPQKTAHNSPADGQNAAKPQDVWHDTDLQITGPVIVELEKLFREHWRSQNGTAMDAVAEGASSRAAEGGEIVRIIGSTPRRLKTRYYVTVLSAIRAAEKNIWITAAYFAPTFQEKRDLMHAARQGIEVSLLLPAHSDSSPALQVQHSHYSELLAAGVKIYERQDGILHSKTMVVDGVYSITGSSNFDHRSVLFNDEVDAVVLGQQTGERLAELFHADLHNALPIDPESWRRRSTLTKLREQFWRLWEKLL
jgi:cardiolipin synthase A/B